MLRACRLSELHVCLQVLTDLTNYAELYRSLQAASFPLVDDRSGLVYNPLAVVEVLMGSLKTDCERLTANPCSLCTSVVSCELQAASASAMS